MVLNVHTNHKVERRDWNVTVCVCVCARARARVRVCLKKSKQFFLVVSKHGA